MDPKHTKSFLGIRLSGNFNLEYFSAISKQILAVPWLNCRKKLGPWLCQQLFRHAAIMKRPENKKNLNENHILLLIY